MKKDTSIRVLRQDYKILAKIAKENRHSIKTMFSIVVGEFSAPPPTPPKEE